MKQLLKVCACALALIVTSGPFLAVRGQDKEDLVKPYFERARQRDREGVVLIGVSQERARAFQASSDERTKARLIGFLVIFPFHCFSTTMSSMVSPAFWM